MISASRIGQSRQGGVYIAVLGTSLIVALLALSAVVGQRIQNRILTSSADICQAQLNANTAVELGLLTMKQDANWRTNKSNGRWFTARGTGAGTCSLEVTDPLDANLANDADEPIAVLGIGYSGRAEQRVELMLDPCCEPIGSLRSAVAAGDTIDLQGDTLRTNGLITASQVSASASQVYGSVEAVSISGSTYNGTTTQIEAAKRPTMPDWATVFDYYRTNGTEINIGSLPTATPNLGRNVGIETAVASSDWTGAPPNIPTATIDQSNGQAHSGTYSLRVKNRNAWYAGAAQPIDGYVKPGQQYTVEAWVLMPSGSARWFHISLYTKGTGSAQFANGTATLVAVGVWTKVSATIVAPSWSGNLEYAFVKVGGGDLSNTVDFYTDDLDIRETTTGRFIYRQVLSPSINPFGAQTNAEGIYWINCAGNKLVIERSRILGTLLVVNPGAGSCIANGPIHWSPAVTGYPALLVDADAAADADFAINATNRALSEKENGVNYNPAGAAHEQFGQDVDTNDIYPSQIGGLVAIEDDLTYQNRALVRGQILVGDDIANASGELEVDFQPDALLNPPAGFWAPYSFSRRPASARKVVLP